MSYETDLDDRPDDQETTCLICPMMCDQPVSGLGNRFGGRAFHPTCYLEFCREMELMESERDDRQRAYEWEAEAMDAGLKPPLIWSADDLSSVPF